jgi:hypothetical protein
MIELATIAPRMNPKTPSTSRKNRYPAKTGQRADKDQRDRRGCFVGVRQHRSDFAPALERLVHRHLVGVFEIAADRDAHRNAGDADAEGFSRRAR